jgi:BirA family biotin operon repressor/biotin-[acetyl-CoA-carboxylase] ligase
LLLRPEGTLAEVAQLSLVASLALAEALIALGPPAADVRVKWPNDVLVRGAKVAGLLLESAAESDERVARLIIGSGVNIASAPADPGYPALTSLTTVPLSGSTGAASGTGVPASFSSSTTRSTTCAGISRLRASAR